MDNKRERFFAGTPGPLRFAFGGFCVAAAGAVLGFSIDYRPGNPLAYLAFGTVATGVAVGIIAVIWGWISTSQRP